MEQMIPVACNRDCLGGCPLVANVEDGCVKRIGNSPYRGPYMEGCVKGFQAARALYAPDRLQHPLIRTGERGAGQFREAPWDEALTLVARRLAEIKARYGAQSILKLGGSGACRGALHNTGSLTARFLHLFGGCTRTYASYSSGAVTFVTPYILGDCSAGLDAGSLRHSNLIILWGANVADCRYGAESAARLREARARRVPIIVIDPRRSATVRELGTQWVPIRPGTDSALLMAVLYVLCTEGLVDRSFVARYSVGFDALEARILGRDGSGPACTPEWAETCCGTPATTIRELARLYGRTKPAALIPGLSMQRTLGGEETARLAVALQVATGNLGRPGGSSGAYGIGFLDSPRMGSLPVPPAAIEPRIPVYRWADAVLAGQSGGYPSDLRAIYAVGINYVTQGADVQKNRRAFQQVEFSVCHDLFLTPTAACCDVVLPATHWLERDDIIFATGNYLLFSNRAVEPPADVRHDYDIFADLAHRLGFGEAFTEGKDEAAWLRSFIAGSDVPDYDEFRRTGIWVAPEQERVAFSDFVADPVAHPLQTPSGRVELLSEAYARETGFSPLPAWRPQPADARYPLQLITPKSRYRLHSQWANIPWFTNHEPQSLWIHPQDAASRGIANGQEVLVESPEGRVHTVARITEDIAPGVVSLLEGFWPAFDADGVDHGGCANTLTSTTPTLPSQASRTHSVLVQVKGVGRG